MLWLIHAGQGLWRFLVAIVGDALEPIQMALVNRTLRAQVFADPDIAALSNDDIAAYLTADGTRAKDLDEKLQKLTAALSVAVTVGGLVGQTMLGDLAASTLKTATAFVFLIAEFYLVIGVVVGFDGLRPRPRYGYGPGFLRLMAEGGAAKRDELVRAANGSLRDNMMRANQASAAATAVRNGILVFAFAVILGLLAAERTASTPLSSTASTLAASPSGSTSTSTSTSTAGSSLSMKPAAGAAGDGGEVRQAQRSVGAAPHAPPSATPAVLPLPAPSAAPTHAAKARP